ncbi:MAG TPA: autotransporter-associated beta strand repeat-containing protein, partial [Verrucomicrobiae bacterium]|nr:autotransporter-associated beta strand repeat-containing protein [Verrucomicrobiae bacterium]
GSLGIGTYKLIKYTGAFNGSLANLTCAAGTLTNPPGEIDLIVSSVRPVANLFWRGDGVSDQWDTGISSTWQNGASLDKFYTGDTNTFDDTAVSFNVNPSGVLVPAASVILVNATHDYTFNNTGGDISGSTGLTKTNTGNLTIYGNNDYTGVTTINGGTLTAQTLASGGVASSIGAATSAATNLVINGGTLAYIGGNVTIDRSATMGNNGGTLNVVGGTTLTLSGVLTGNGSLTKTGNGQITLNNANTYLGGTIVSGGTLRGDPGATIGTNTLTVDGTVNAATFQIAGNSQTLADTLNVIGVNGILAVNGNDTAGNFAGSGTINLNGNSGNILTLQAADTTSFAGTFLLNTLPDLRLLPSSGTTLNASNATFNLGSGSGVLNNRNGGSFFLGALAGGPSTFVRGGSADTPITSTYTIGGNNVSSDFSGIIANGTTANNPKSAIVKVGTGRLTLSGANTYTGSTTVSSGALVLGDGSSDGSINNSTPITLSTGSLLDVSLRSDATFTVGGSATQVLQGSGTIFGQLNVGSSGTVAPGDATPTIGKLVVTNAVTLGGTVSLKLNRTNSPNCDTLSSSNVLTYGGTLTVANVGDALHAGDTFTVFKAAGGFSGSFAQTNLPVLAGGMSLSWNPATAQLTVISSVNTAPTNIVTSISGNTLTLTWPTDHTGWRLQVQTNSRSVGLSSNWTDVTGATGTNSVTATVDPTKGAVFYRLVYP